MTLLSKVIFFVLMFFTSHTSTILDGIYNINNIELLRSDEWLFKMDASGHHPDELLTNWCLKGFVSNQFPL